MTMPSAQSLAPKLDSVPNIIDYLQESLPLEAVSSTTSSTVVDSRKVNIQLKAIKKEKKEKELATPKEIIQVLPSGRVRYGPITVNPRKKPSKTLFTGRRSKYEILSGEEEEKRRLRRDRNRLAATAYREKRDQVLINLEDDYAKEERNYIRLSKTINDLKQRKHQLETLLSNQIVNYPLQPSMVYNETNYYPTAAPILPLQAFPLPVNTEEFYNFIPPQPVLTNSTNLNDFSNSLFNSQIQQQQQEQQLILSSSSLNRFFDTINTPTQMDNSNNLPKLINSAYGSSTCARQHSNSGEDESMASTQANSYVC